MCFPQASLEGAEVVVIPAGVPRKPGMTRDDLFNTNASIVATVAQACAKVCHKHSSCLKLFYNVCLVFVMVLLSFYSLRFN